MKETIITRKISLSFTKDQDVPAAWKELRSWNNVIYRSANFVSTHRYFAENIKEFFYLTEEVKLKLTSIDKDENGIFNTSPLNAGYQLLSEKFKGTTPTAMLSAINNNVTKTFNTQKKDYYLGKRSLNTYRSTIPMPLPVQAMRNLKLTDDKKNYTFETFGLKFQTFFGRDRSGNKIMMDMAVEGTRKLCDSSIMIDGKDIFLLAVFKFDTEKVALDTDVAAVATLSCEYPISLQIGKSTLQIGNREEYLYRRLAIAGALQRSQKNARYAKGGHGRSRKMQSIDRFHDMERDYIRTRQHQYTARMIKLCEQNKCGTLILRYHPEPPSPPEISTKERNLWYIENGFLLRNWGYNGLSSMIEYKCQKAGITLIIEKGTDEEEMPDTPDIRKSAKKKNK